MSSEIRNKKLKINIIAGFVLKGLSIVIGFVFIPLVLNYLTSSRYGIWLTINSVIAWFSYFDIGLSGSLRLKLQEFFANKDYDKAKEYISTTYIVLAAIAITLSIIITTLLLILDINYSSFFKASRALQSELSLVMIITVCCFFIRFILQPISTILMADQNNSIASLILLTENILNLIGIFILSYFTQNSLLLACLVFAVSPLINLLIYTFVLFSKKYKQIKPAINAFRYDIIKSMMGVSLDIFIISISLILLIQTNNLMITSLFSSNQVTEYNISYKLFSTFGTVFTLMVTPLWSSIGEAYHLNDFIWIKNTMKRVLKFYLLIVFGMVILVPFGSEIIFLWTKLRVENYYLFISIAVYFIVQNFMMIYSFLFNGMGIVKLQRNMAIYGAIVNIPVILFLVKVLHWGLQSVLIANTIAILPSLFLYPFIAKKKLNNISLNS